MTGVLEAASRPSRRGGVVREHEVLRIAGRMKSDAVDTAIGEVLRWAQKRCGGELPPEAWAHESFDYFAGGRNGSCVRLRSGDADIWTIRADDPDKSVPGRVWTHEVVVGTQPEQPAKFSVRQLVSTSETDLLIEPHVPGFVHQIADRSVVLVGSEQIAAHPTVYETESDAEDLIGRLIDSGRQLPVFVFTSAEGRRAVVDGVLLGRAILGIGHVALVHEDAAWHLTRELGRSRSVFGGAARVYLPDFSRDADRYAHPLVLANQLQDADGVSRTVRWMRQLAANESIRRAKLGRDVLPYAEIKAASLRLRQQMLVVEQASDTDQLAAANDRIAELEKQLASLATEQDYYLSEYGKERDRAEVSEAQARASAYRIQQLTAQMKARGDDPDQGVALPTTWAALQDWCDETLAGRLVLTPKAARGLRDPLYQDVEMAARCLLWLASECRDQRINGGGGAMSNVPIMEGIQNASCGADTYEFDWGGRRFEADWHIKSGGNTRDPARCLRIYYCFDEQTQQIIVSEMPAHRRTSAS